MTLWFDEALSEAALHPPRQKILQRCFTKNSNDHGASSVQGLIAGQSSLPRTTASETFNAPLVTFHRRQWGFLWRAGY
jgi:hypothetical protein